MRREEGEEGGGGGSRSLNITFSRTKDESLEFPRELSQKQPHVCGVVPCLSRVPALTQPRKPRPAWPANDI